MNLIEKKELVSKYIKAIVSKSASGLNELVSADGGALVGQSLADLIYDAMDYTGIIYQDMIKIEATGFGNGIRVPYSINPLTDEPSVGIRAYWLSEAQQKVNSKAQLGVSVIEFEKLVAKVPMTDELLQDVGFKLTDYLVKEIAKQMIYKIEKAAFVGVNKSVKGVAGDGGKATLAVAITAEPTEAELMSMIDALNPLATNAKFYVSKAIFTHIIGGQAYTNDNELVFEDGVYHFMGYPIVVAPQLTAAPYQIVLGDFTKYALGIKNIKTLISEDVRFLEDESELRVVLRVGGEVIAENLDMDDVSTYGFFVVNVGTYAEESSSSSSSSSEDYSSSSLSSSSSSDSSDSSSSSSDSSDSSDSSSSSESSSSGE